MDSVLTPRVLYKRVDTTSFLNLTLFRSQMLEHAESAFVFRRPVEGLSLVAIDEGTKMCRDQSRMFFISFKKLCRCHTAVPGAGDLCLGVSQFKSSSCCKYMQTDVGVSNSIVRWIMQRLIAQEMLLQDLVFSIGVMVYSFPKSVVQLFAGLLARAYFFVL